MEAVLGPSVVVVQPLMAATATALVRRQLETHGGSEKARPATAAAGSGGVLGARFLIQPELVRVVEKLELVALLEELLGYWDGVELREVVRRWLGLGLLVLVVVVVGLVEGMVFERLGGSGMEVGRGVRWGGGGGDGEDGVAATLHHELLHLRHASISRLHLFLLLQTSALLFFLCSAILQ